MKCALTNKDLITLSNQIYQVLSDDNKLYAKRCKKTKIIDGFIFKLLNGQINSSQEKVTALMNSFHKCKRKEERISRSSFVDRENQIDIALYEKVLQLITKFTNKYIYKSNCAFEVFCIDGTDINMSKELSKEGYKLNPSKETVNGNVMGIYNVTYNYPVDIKLAKHHNERRAVNDFFNNTNEYKGMLFMYDRGYWSKDMVTLMEQKKLKYIFRLPESLRIVIDNVSGNASDKTIDFEGYKLRVLKYAIGSKSYYIATNLLDTKQYSIDVIKQLYHQRWDIEEFFKYIKQNMKLAYPCELSEKSVLKSLYAQLIVSRLVYLMMHIKSKTNKPNSVINKSVLTDGFYREFLLHFIYNKGFKRSYLKMFVFNNIVYTHTQKGMHYKRIGIKPNTKWYVKRSKRTQTNGEKDNEAKVT